MIGRYGLFVLALTLAISAGARDQFDLWVDRTELPPVLVDTSVEVRDRHSGLLRVYPVEDGRIRMALRLRDVDPQFIDMLIAYEDKRFFRHSGVDARALLRAVGQAIRSGEIVSGGSTLTMQLARLLENSGTGQWRGKVRQIRLALALEQHLSKEQILELYLTHAPYGGPIEGLRAATLAWFGKPPGRLSATEAAFLVALPQSPETRRPDRYPEQAHAAVTRVLERVAQNAGEVPTPLPNKMRPFPLLAPHLSDHAVAEDQIAPIHALTVDAELQHKLERLAARAVQGGQRGLSAAIIVADHTTGEVLASVGSSAFSAEDGSQGYVDMTRALRSPGSTLKPFIYAMAFDQGMAHPDTLIEDTPRAFGRYEPQNFDGFFRGTVTMREALQLSLNIPPVALTQELGPNRLMALMRKGGATPTLSGGRPGLAIALGGVGLNLKDLVQLYGGLAAGGRSVPLVWRKGERVQPKHLLSRAAAWHVGNILADVPPPPGYALQGNNIAHKTGTSYGHRDAWAIGYDGRHVIGVWLGKPDGTPVPGAFGGELAAPVLFEAFGRLKAKADPLPPPPPETVIASTIDLPKPLQRFRGRDAVFVPGGNAPRVTFPPDGATLVASQDGLPMKLKAGRLPFAILVDGTPHATNIRQRELLLSIASPGFTRVTVIDADGRGASVNIRLK